MSILQISKIQIRTGNIADLPQLSEGEFGWAADAKRLFVGNDPNVVGPAPDNTEILTQYSDITAAGSNTQVQFNDNNILGATSAFTFNKVTSTLTIANVAVTGNGAVTGNFSIAGNLSVGGIITYYDITNVRVSDPIIELGGGPNGTPLTSNDGKDRGTVLKYYTTAPVSAFMGWDNSNGEFAFGSNVTVVNDVITFNNLGNVRARTFIGNVVGNVTGNVTGNIVGNIVVPGANTQVLINNSGVVGASPNMTFDGNTLTVLGNITASYFSGNGSALSSIAGGNVIGFVPNAVHANTATVASSVAGANVTGTVANANYASFAGTAFSVTGGNVSGEVANANYASFAGTAFSITGANVTGTVANANYAAFAGTAFSVAGANVTGTVANATYATSAGSAATATTAATVTTAAQPNITSVGTLTSLGVSGNTTTGGILTDNYYYANGVAISFYSNTNVSNYLPTYYSTVGATTLTTGANINAGNITGNWTLGSGSRLNATYADLAEYYMPDQKYEAGTVLAFGGEHEVTLSTSENYQRIAGVVSNNSAYTMNNGIADQGVCIALIGRIPVKVSGKISKGDLLRASPHDAGTAIADGDGGIVGRALENYDSLQIGTIEVMVGRT